MEQRTLMQGTCRWLLAASFILSATPLIAGPNGGYDRYGPAAAELDRRGQIAQRARQPHQAYRQGRNQAATPRVRFNMEPRRAGSGYNNTRYDRRVAQPRGILKHTSQHRQQRRAARFERRVPPAVRADMAHRGQQARLTRQRPKMDRVLRQTAPRSSVRAVSRTPVRTASRTPVRTASRTPVRTASRSAAQRGSRAVAGRTATRQVSRAGRSLLTPRNLARGAAGGAATAAVGYGVYLATGVEVPDSFDTGVRILKDPLNTPKHINQFGKDSINATGQIVGKVVGSKRAGRDLSNGMHSAAKTVGKEACKVGALFGAKC